MSSNPSSKPQLIAIEGPAGVGKTTLLRALGRALEARGVAVGVLAEFSNTPLGRRLKAEARYGRSKPDWVLGAGGLFAFLSDKLHALEGTLRETQKVWLADRFTISQLVLSLGWMKAEPERALAREVIAQTVRWAGSRFSDASAVVLLSAPKHVLEERLRQRLKCELTPEQSRLLGREVRQYAELKAGPEGWKHIELRATAPPKALAEQIIEMTRAGREAGLVRQ